LFLIGIESILYNHTEDFSELFKIIRNLIKGKSNQTDDLCMYLLSALAKPAGYIRNSVKKVFKLFVNEISEEFLSKLCEIIKTGNVNIETSVEEPTEESNKDNVLFENGKNSLKNQEKIIKDTFLIKANDMLELILKKSSNTRHRLIVYESLVSSLRAVSKTKEKQYLIGKFASILDKISKKDLKITNEYEAQVTNIVNLCVKGMDRDKNINKVLTKTSSAY
jgi:DNA polymerase phi.